MRSMMAVAALLLLSLPALTADREKEKRDPKELGRVVILPFLDISGERQEAKSEYRDTVLDEVEERFLKHEIAFVSRAELGEALKSMGMAVTDEEDRTKPRFKDLAERVKARYLVTGIIHGAGSGISRRGAFGEAHKAGQAKIQLKVFDAQENRYVEEMELTATSTARAGAFGGVFTRSNKLRVKAVRDATKKAMAALLKPYPKVHDSVPDRD